MASSRAAAAAAAAAACCRGCLPLSWTVRAVLTAAVARLRGHFAATPSSPSLLKHLLTGEAGAAE